MCLFSGPIYFDAADYIKGKEEIIVIPYSNSFRLPFVVKTIIPLSSSLYRTLSSHFNEEELNSFRVTLSLCVRFPSFSHRSSDFGIFAGLSEISCSALRFIATLSSLFCDSFIYLTLVRVPVVVTNQRPKNKYTRTERGRKTAGFAVFSSGGQ